MKERALSFLEKRFKFDVRYTFHGGFWLLIGHVVSMSAILVTSYIFANFLSPETYGQYKYIISIGSLLSAFSLTGAATSITQAAARNITGFYSYMKRTSLLYGLIISALATIGALYYYVQGNTSLALGLVIIALFQPLFNNAPFIFSYLQGTQQFKLSTYCHAARTVFTTAVIATSALVTENITILLISYFLAQIVSGFVVQYFYAPKAEKITDTEASKSLLKYTKHSSLQNIVSGISNQLDKVLIFQNLGAAELAIYTFATALPDQYKGITKAIEMMLLPRFSQQSEKAVRAGIIYKSVIYFIFLLLCLAIYIVAAPYIFSLLFPQYEASVFLSQIYVVGIIFGIGGIPLAAIKSQMSNKKLYHFNALGSAFQIVSLLILLPLFGLIGAAIARSLYRGFICVYAYYLYFKN